MDLSASTRLFLCKPSGGIKTQYPYELFGCFFFRFFFVFSFSIQFSFLFIQLCMYFLRRHDLGEFYSRTLSHVKRKKHGQTTQPHIRSTNTPTKAIAARSGCSSPSHPSILSPFLTALTFAPTPAGASLLSDSLSGLQKERPATASLVTGGRQTMVHKSVQIDVKEPLNAPPIRSYGPECG